MNVRELVGNIKKGHEERLSGIIQGRTLLHRTLGEIFEAGLKIEADDKAVAELKSEVEAVKEIAEKHSRWLHSEDRTPFDFLLVLILGFEGTTTKRHYYANAFRNAKAASISTVDEFVDWVDKKGGAIEAGSHRAEGESGGGREMPKDIIANFVASLPEPEVATGEGDEENLSLSVDFEPQDEAEGIGLLLVRRLPDGTVRIIKTVTDPQAIASVIRQTDGTPSPAKLEAARKAAIYDLNRFMLKKYGRKGVWRGDLEAKDYTAFKRAVEVIASQPQLAARYFEGTPNVEIAAEALDIRKMNNDVHVLDPARFIGNAKPFALVPYGLKQETQPSKEGLEAIPDYLRWKKSPPRRRPA